MSLEDIAGELDVDVSTVRGWHEGGGDSPPALQAVAKAMRAKTPKAAGDDPRYPRRVVDAFAQAVGLRDAFGRPVRGEGKSRMPLYPTVEPGPKKRRRWYEHHAAAELQTQKGGLPEPDGYDELDRPYWYRSTLFYHQPEDSLSLADIAREYRVSRQTAQRWHKGAVRNGKAPAIPSALQATAALMEVPLPELAQPRPRYPRQVVQAFAKGVGFLNDKGEFVEELVGRTQGRWLPLEPTVDPRPEGLRRMYLPHVAAELGWEGASIAPIRSRHQLDFPEEDGHDELARPYWFPFTIEDYKRYLTRRRMDRVGAPEPDGYDEDGEPYWLPPSQQ
ncbi:hypothetical protein [Streptomyces nanshensis]|uniref:hypothetical protein n=1 Tax=Streptomyces nanshensis TaxID=518642 RepID=UPI00114D24E4|nr:hypothetical protein [Streptomyces nanshensis]